MTHAPFQNDQIDETNVYNQVSLLAVNCLGRAIVPSVPQPGLHDGHSRSFKEQRPAGARFEDQLVYDQLVIAKLDMLKKIKEEAVANMEFEKALKAQEAIRITQSVGENLNNIFKVKLRWIREGDQAQADLFDDAYKTVKETLEQYTFEYDEA